MSTNRARQTNGENPKDVQARVDQVQGLQVSCKGRWTTLRFLSPTSRISFPSANMAIEMEEGQDPVFIVERGRIQYRVPASKIEEAIRTWLYTSKENKERQYERR